MKKSQTFTKVSNAVIDDKKLKAQSKALYMAICRYANNDTKSCYPSKATLLKAAGISDKTFRAGIEQLEKRRYISVNKRFDGDGRQLSNMYVLRK